MTTSKQKRVISWAPTPSKWQVEPKRIYNSFKTSPFATENFYQTDAEVLYSLCSEYNRQIIMAEGEISAAFLRTFWAEIRALGATHKGRKEVDFIEAETSKVRDFSAYTDTIKRAQGL